MKRIVLMFGLTLTLLLLATPESYAQGAPCQFCNGDKNCQDTPKGFSGQLGCQSGWQCGNPECANATKICWFTGAECQVPRDDEPGGGGWGGGGGGGGWCDVLTPSWECDPWEWAANQAPAGRPAAQTRCANAATRNGAMAAGWAPPAARRTDE